MTKPAQKKIEKDYMDAFLELMSFPPVVIEQECPPKPDFTLRIEDPLIGVEMTEYHSVSTTASGHPRKAVEQEWERLRKAVMKAVDISPALQGIQGIFSFNDLNLPSRKETEEFVAQAVVCAKSTALPDSSTVCVHDSTEYPQLQTYLSKFRLRRIRCSMSWDWNHNSAWIGVDKSAFLKCIQRKTQKTYDLNGLDQMWLLIVSGPSLSQAMGVELQHHLPHICEADEALQKSNFCRTFVFQYMFDAVYEWPGWRKACT